VLAYQQTVQKLAGAKFRTRSSHIKKIVTSAGSKNCSPKAAQRSDQLSLVLYQHGGASYLQVLTNESNYFSAELNLVQAQLNERLALGSSIRRSAAAGNSDCLVAVVGSVFWPITSAQYPRHRSMYVRCLARHLIFIVFNSNKSERSFK